MPNYFNKSPRTTHTISQSPNLRNAPRLGQSSTRSGQKPLVTNTRCASCGGRRK